MSTEIKKADPKDAIKAIAMNIGKNVEMYVEWMFPEAVEAASSSFLLSIRHSIYNEVMCALESNQDMVAQLKHDVEHRRYMRKMMKQIRKPKLR